MKNGSQIITPAIATQCCRRCSKKNLIQIGAVIKTLQSEVYKYMYIVTLYETPSNGLCMTKG